METLITRKHESLMQNCWPLETQISKSKGIPGYNDSVTFTFANNLLIIKGQR